MNYDKTVTTLQDQSFLCLKHTADHGDTTPALRLYQECQFFHKAKAEQLKKWFRKFSGDQIICRNGNWYLRNTWRHDAFLFKEAKEHPFQ